MMRAMDPSHQTVRRALVKRRYEFDIREEALPSPAEGELLVEVAACAVCGTDLAIAGKTAEDWQPFGHEIAGVVRATGDGVTRFAPGDRVALDSSAPCGTCERCRQGRPLECRDPRSYWGQWMGFADRMIAPQEVAYPAADLSPTTACLLEPAGVSVDLVDVGEVGEGDRVLIIGPGPLGLLAIPACRRRGAARIWVAGRSHSKARLEAAVALGADEIITVDTTELEDADFGKEGVNRILVVAPPTMLPAAAEIGCVGSIISYIGISWDESARIELDADKFHFKRQQLRASMAAPGTRGAEALALLRSGRFDPQVVLSHRFTLDDIAAAMAGCRDDKATSKKKVMINPESDWQE